MQKLLKSSVVPATATLTLLVLIAGCGQKGPLTLPAASSPASAASTAAR